ncbi:MAG: protein kinase domain-containing protein [Gemmatimonadales bacterium]
MADLPADVARALHTQFQLERQLGLGGMATVYLARDLKHKRPVALKLLNAELGSSLGPRRFRLEIETAARLHHPHICPVYDSGEAYPGTSGGAPRLWFTMPFVPGGTLRDRLRREGRLAIEEALRIIRETAGALQYAHDEGVIHRDIKPENILLSHHGSTLVADFGVARPMEPPDGGHITGAGLAVGTPTYMAPEQATGDGAVDARADQYALAVTAYEMLAGAPPFVGPTAAAILSIRYTRPTPSLRADRPEVSPAVDEALRRALAVEPAERFGSVAEFARALETGSPAPLRRRGWTGLLAAAAVAALLAAGGVFAWRAIRSTGVSVAPAAVKVLAVLPFENLGDSSDVYFADGVTDEVRAKLAQVGGLDVIARSSSSEYRRSGKPPSEIARELGANYLLTGTVRWERSPGGGSRVRVIPELVEIGPGGAPRTRWGQQFDAAITDVFAVQADIAGRVAQALDIALAAGTRERLAALPTRNIEAYTAYLRGREVSSGERSPDALRAALAEFERAVALDDRFAAAWAELAMAQLDAFQHGGTQSKDAEAAGRSVERARALAPASPDTRLASGRHQLVARGDAVAALAEYQAGLGISPGEVDLLSATADAELHLGRWADGLADLEHAARLDPRSPFVLGELADTYGRMGRFREARDAIARARELRPTSMSLAYTDARIAAAQGHLAEVRAILRAMEPIHGARTVVAFVALREDLIWALDDEHQRIVLQLTPADLDGGRADWALALAETHWLRGNRGLARGYGETAVGEFAALLSGWGDRGGRGQILALRAMSLAYAGRRDDAIAEGERSNEIQPLGERVAGPYTRYLLTRIYLLAGQPDKAMERIEAMLRVPDLITASWVRIDPTLARLRESARYREVVGTGR